MEIYVHQILSCMKENNLTRNAKSIITISMFVMILAINNPLFSSKKHIYLTSLRSLHFLANTHWHVYLSNREIFIHKCKHQWINYDYFGLSFFTMYTYFACNSTGTVNSVTCLIGTEWMTWVLTVFSIWISTSWKKKRPFCSCLLTKLKTEFFFIMTWGYFLPFPKHKKNQIPVLQLGPLQPAWQLHAPSVCSHVLQFEEQICEQFLP